MKVLLICYVNPPENATGGVMSRQLAEDLVAAGHEVTLITGFPNHPDGELYPGWKRRWRLIEQEEPYRIVRTWHVVTRSKRALRRSLFYATFALTSFLNALFLGRFDLVYCDSTPIFGGLSCWAIALAKRCAHIYTIFDIYPEAIIDAGLMAPGLATRMLLGLDCFVCRHAERVMVISEGMKQKVADRGIPEGKIVVLPMWMDDSDVGPVPRLNAWRKEQGIAEDVFVVLYAGTVGPVQGPEVLIEAATELSREPDILFLLVAQGLSRPNMERMARERQLSNVRFMDFQPRERLAEVQATADVSVVTLLAGQGRNFFPSKVLAYMAARRPVIASVDAQSDTARLVEESGGGRVVPPGDAHALAEAVRELRKAPEECQRLGEQARQHFEAHYSRGAATGVYGALFREVHEERRGGSHDPNQASGAR